MYTCAWRIHGDLTPQFQSHPYFGSEEPIGTACYGQITGPRNDKKPTLSGPLGPSEAEAGGPLAQFLPGVGEESRAHCRQSSNRSSCFFAVTLTPMAAALRLGKRAGQRGRESSE